MKKIDKVECPRCKVVQELSIVELVEGDEVTEGTFPYTCDKCGTKFTVEFKLESYVRTY